MYETACTADNFAKNPIIRYVATGRYGYAYEYDEQIGHGQICYELVGHCLHTLVEQHEIDNNEVAKQAYHKYDGVDDDKHSTRPVVGLLVRVAVEIGRRRRRELLEAPVYDSRFINKHHPETKCVSVLFIYFVLYYIIIFKILCGCQ